MRGGLVRIGKAREGMEWSGMVSREMQWRGMAWVGMASRGQDVKGLLRFLCLTGRQPLFGRGVVGVDWTGWVRPGEVWCGVERRGVGWRDWAR